MEVGGWSQSSDLSMSGISIGMKCLDRGMKSKDCKEWWLRKMKRSIASQEEWAWRQKKVKHADHIQGGRVWGLTILLKTIREEHLKFHPLKLEKEGACSQMSWFHIYIRMIEFHWVREVMEDITIDWIISFQYLLYFFIHSDLPLLSHSCFLFIWVYLWVILFNNSDPAHQI